MTVIVTAVAVWLTELTCVFCTTTNHSWTELVVLPVTSCGHLID